MRQVTVIWHVVVQMAFARASSSTIGKKRKRGEELVAILSTSSNPYMAIDLPHFWLDQNRIAQKSSVITPSAMANCLAKWRQSGGVFIYCRRFRAMARSYRQHGK